MFLVTCKYLVSPLIHICFWTGTDYFHYIQAHQRLKGEAWMNVRKPIDYGAVFAALDLLMTVALPQMELHCEIGRLVSGRPEKGAAIAASEYLCDAYLDVSGFFLEICAECESFTTPMRGLRDAGTSYDHRLDGEYSHPGGRADYPKAGMVYPGSRAIRLICAIVMTVGV